MAEYRLKTGEEAFQVVDGPFRRRRYEPGNIYNEIPPEEASRFEEVRPAAPSRKTKKDGEK
jgi:hypothetical protein